MTDPFATATDLTAALRSRRISSREVLELYLDRIARFDPVLGAVVTLDVERAWTEAAAADEAAARAEPLGPLHGIPITVKDCIETAGVRTTCGAPALADHVPARDAVAVARPRAAGAVVVGKTNTPAYVADAQTYNPLFGTTNNPWDHARSPGGSSGGPAAAVAAGLTGFDLGSDLGGSIRMPAGYCGVYGLRPTTGIVPTLGHIPPGPEGLGELELGTVGPITRGAADLGLVLDAVAGPADATARAWALRLPPPRGDRLTAYRIGAWLDDPYCPVAAEVIDVLAEAVTGLRRAGARVDEVRPVDLGQSARLFQRLVQPMMSVGLPDDAFAELVSVADSPERSSRATWARHVSARFREYGVADQERLAVQARWRDFFRDYDAVLCPITPTAALEHDQSPGDRSVTIDGVVRDYWTQVRWTQAISIASLPVAAVPVGRTAAGLPVGMQLIGPHLEDHTVVDLATRLEAVLGGFGLPPGY